MVDVSAIRSCRIHPVIGVARVGNSPDAFFIGPEAPGELPNPGGGFKDHAGRVKRQAARFRIYGYDATGRMVGEITAADATIRWSVHLANRKGAAEKFRGVAAVAKARAQGTPLPLRNEAHPHARSGLVIDPGPRSIQGANAWGAAYHFAGGSFLGVPVPLGELRTDARGRLLVLGGSGAAGSAREGVFIVDAVNNDGWYDDTSDGPVSAQVALSDGRELDAESAWVIVAPPDFSPHTQHLVTLYDLMREPANGWETTDSAEVSFTHDIYPILARLAGYQWVNDGAMRGHGPGKGANPLAPETLAQLADAGERARRLRERFFHRLRNPAGGDAKQASRAFMPPLSGEGGQAREGEPSTWLTLLPSQYERMRRWAAGEFHADWPGKPPAVQPLAALPLERQPAALDRAALEGCCGGAFYPGVEVSYVTRGSTLDDPRPGALTQDLAVPWQAAAFARGAGWWPAQRPDEVIAESAYLEALAEFPAEVQEGKLAMLLFNRVPWARGIGTQRDRYTGPPGFAAHNDMARRWSELGIVQQRRTPAGEVLLVESERAPYALLRDRDYFYFLLNIEAHADFLPIAAALAEEFVENARRHANDPNLPTTQHHFRYSREALHDRLDEIYNGLAEQTNMERSSNDDLYNTWSNARERILQLAPWSQLDGSWLHQITPNGPLDEVQTLLFQIWIDELGSGDLAQHHATLYTNLLRDLGINLPDPHSRAYSDEPNFLDSAFTVPVMVLSLAQFSRHYFAELLGLTLMLEWEVLDAKPFIEQLRHLGIPTQFYDLHVGIDNAVSGHGAKAKRAVELYMEQVYDRGGEAAMQAEWRRVWTGYTLLAVNGRLARDLKEKLLHRPSLHQRMIEMIERKQPYAVLNHGRKSLGGTPINDRFDDPEGLLTALAESPLVVAGRPEESEILQRFTVAGPMYGVFDEREQTLWADWIRSLGREQPESDQPPAAANAAQVRQMVSLLDRLRPWWQPRKGEPLLAGPDPHARDGSVRQPLDWWFRQSTPALMQALARRENGLVVAGDVGRSRLLDVLTRDQPGVAVVVRAEQQGSGGRDGEAIVAAWIEDGCRTPPLPRLRLSLSSHPDVAGALPPEYLRGMGTVH